ncbi:PPA1309 family protein [Rhodococcus sp. NPDC058505]|uniref:PPA1309 family protein n=1 Tax=unclassified Rhodococcus (in: high G+C Gram-positive bacteria) TaxID=192944 RepID=UPI003651586B
MNDFDGTPHPARISADALPRCVQEVAGHVDPDGWGQPPRMFALVPTAAIAVAEPHLIDQLEAGSELTPIEQHPLPDDLHGTGTAIEEYLGTTSWSEGVAGCLLVQEILVLPPAASEELNSAVSAALAGDNPADDVIRASAGAHPERRAARLFAAVLRDGRSECALALAPDEDDDPFAEPELRTGENLAPGLVHALHATFEATDDDW